MSNSAIRVATSASPITPARIGIVPSVVKKRLALDVSFYKLVQILSVTLFEQMPISIAVFDIGSQFDEIDDSNQP